MRGVRERQRDQALLFARLEYAIRVGAGEEGLTFADVLGEEMADQVRQMSATEAIAESEAAADADAAEFWEDQREEPHEDDEGEGLEEGDAG